MTLASRRRGHAVARTHSTRNAPVRTLRCRTSAAGRAVRFKILGPLEITSDVGTVSWQGRKRRGLLALLLVHRASPLAVDRIVDELWGEPTGGAPNTVQTYLSQLRKVLDGHDGAALTRHGGGYRLDIARDALDAARFERLLS